MSKLGLARKTTSPPAVSQMSRKCVIHNISQPYSPPQPVTGIALFLLYFYCSQQTKSMKTVHRVNWKICETVEPTASTICTIKTELSGLKPYRNLSHYTYLFCDLATSLITGKDLDWRNVQSGLSDQIIKHTIWADSLYFLCIFMYVYVVSMYECIYIISGTGSAICTSVVVAMVDDSTGISWESVYKILLSWVDVLIFFTLFYLELCIWPDAISRWI
jgi:hypothetical protein